MPGTPETILAFDFGLRRIGVAVGQQITDSANPLTVVANGTRGPDWPHIARLINEWRPARLIVGMPLHADGGGSEIADSVREFVADLERFGIDVVTVDERYSSLEAQHRCLRSACGGQRGRIGKRHD